MGHGVRSAAPQPAYRHASHPTTHDHRIPEVRAASLLALMGVFDLVGTTGTGWLSDGWRSRHLLAWY